MTLPLSPSRIALSLLLTAAATVLVACPAPAERYSLAGDEVVLYNLAGRLDVEPGTGSAVVVELERGGRDGSRLEVQTGSIDTHPTLRVLYPERDIVYRRMGAGSSTTMQVEGDGRFGGD